jgi:hypothetical protein
MRTEAENLKVNAQKKHSMLSRPFRPTSNQDMESTTQPPRQFNQPSRKGKKAWRKNVDITEVQEGLEVVRDEIITGYVGHHGPGDYIFANQWTSSAAGSL